VIKGQGRVDGDKTHLSKARGEREDRSPQGSGERKNHFDGWRSGKKDVDGRCHLVKRPERGKKNVRPQKKEGWGGKKGRGTPID